MGNIIPARRDKPSSKRELMACLISPAASDLTAVREALAERVDPARLALKIIALQQVYRYGSPPVDERVEKAALAIWIKALGGFPEWAIDAAIDGYAAEETRPPTPAALAERCVAAKSEVRLALDKAARPTEAPKPRLTRERMAEIARETFRPGDAIPENLRRIMGD